MSRKLIPLLASTLLALVSFVTPASTTYASNTSTSSATKPCTRSVIASMMGVHTRMSPRMETTNDATSKAGWKTTASLYSSTHSISAMDTTSWRTVSTADTHVMP